MTKFLRIAIIFLLSASVYSCSSANEELSRSGKAKAAQDRINSSQSGSSSVFKDIK